MCFEFIHNYKSKGPRRSNLHFLNFGSGFDSIAGDCDTVISVAGTMMWDLRANGKVVGLTAMVKNQMSNFDYTIRNGQALEVLDPTNLKLDVVALESLLFDSSVRKPIYSGICEKYDLVAQGELVSLSLKTFRRVQESIGLLNSIVCGG